MKHSLFSASAAERWANCAGSLAMSLGLTDTPSEAAAEGTAGHELADTVLRNPNTSAEDFVGHVFNDVEITLELAQAVDEYVEYVRGISGLKLTEVRVNYAEILGVEEEEGFGTSDTVIVDDELLHVVDLKLGRGYVGAQNNKQMILYALGALLALHAAGERISLIRLHIVQPRVTTTPVPFDMTLAELLSAADQLRFDAQLAQEALIAYTGPDNVAWVKRYLRAGEKQCQWCRAAAGCPALRNDVSRFTQDFDEVKAPDALTAMTNAKLAEWQRLVPLAALWTKAVGHETLRRLTAGQKVPGYKMVLGREGHRKWSDEEKAAQEFADVEGALTKPHLISPAQLEKILKKEKARMEPFISRNPARPTLTTADDPRAEWSESAQASEFDVVSKVQQN